MSELQIQNDRAGLSIFPMMLELAGLVAIQPRPALLNDNSIDYPLHYNYWLPK
jgi:hypothetical protein